MYPYMPPLKAIMLLAIDCTPKPVDQFVSAFIWNSKSGNDLRHELYREGLIKKDDNGDYRTTEKGKVFIIEMLKTPQPVQKWVAPCRAHAYHDEEDD